LLKEIAVVGAGYWGKNLIRNFFELGALKAVCDTQQNLVKSYQSKYPTVSFTNLFSKLLSDSSIKGIVIATPAETHFNLVKQALLADRDVFVEKPFVLKLKEGKKLAEFAEKTKKSLWWVIFLGIIQQ